MFMVTPEDITSLSALVTGRLAGTNAALSAKKHYQA